ncbi:penicillin-binding protein 1A [Candidatus Enterovibrio altilux]|uniref:Penicillin-binding protein 1A n=1 Tax=Candidatus Enterovibrio altilux TaxID=1927128 RepID=A0A291B8U3_9GAMM|nr:PBP1A family penicillin-binding protein [Candidatus Enterovibrio luxaltus]ATF09425.1 Multimodular transpeptidase-transglycosylase [Candidatus Enterovibrio luxaltus]
MKFIKRLIILAFICMLLGLGTVFGFYFFVKLELPDVATLKDIELQTPMQIYSIDGKLISQFGEKRRIPIMYDQIPQNLIEALIATEDHRFYEHSGIDPIGIIRAALVVIMSGSVKQGASTITQQLARNFFLSNEKKIMRKIKEIFIAIHIETLLSKQEIMELYVNQIFLGYRSYGFGAAARVYFGKDLDKLTLSEIATLAGMPKAPSTMNPLYSIERATNRRNVVLGRMLTEGYITHSEYEQTKNKNIVASYHEPKIELNAPYVAELARAWAVAQYGDNVYKSGMKVYTTIDSRLQNLAQHVAISNLLSYDQRHGYRGAVAILWDKNSIAWDTIKIEVHLKNQPSYGELKPAVVMTVTDKTAKVKLQNNKNIILSWDGIKWARRYVTDTLQGSAPQRASDILSAGEQIWVQYVNQEWHLSQMPAANTAMVAISPKDGAVQALVGGFNFAHSKFNRVTQSIRQVGSGIKPFIYSVAIDQGMTLATLINDAPINRWDSSQGTAWRPKNSPPIYDGPTRLRIGLAQSKNVMAVRVLRRIGLNKTINFLTKFGFNRANLPRSEALALGAGSLTPIEVAQGFSIFINGGYYIKPYYISKVENPFGKELHKAKPKSICKNNCNVHINKRNSSNLQEEENLLDQTDDIANTSQLAPQVISEQNAFLVREMLQANIWGGGSWRNGTGWNGTGWRAQKPLNRRDIGGKTGTTNDSKDAWYSGFAPGLVATVWVGFDNNARNLGRTSNNTNLKKIQISGAESGAKTAQPAWIDFMINAIAHVPEQRKEIPSGIVQVRIDRHTGLLTRKADGSAMFEYFEQGTEPTEYVSAASSHGNIYESEGEELF